MAINKNSDISRRIIDEAKLQLSIEEVPSKIASSIVPVLIANPKYTIECVHGNAVDTTATNIKTTKTTKDTYLHGFTISVTKDASNTGGYTRLYFDIDGITRYFYLRYRPSTAGENNMVMTFPTPMLLDKNSVIALSNENGTASIDASATILFNEVD